MKDLETDVLKVDENLMIPYSEDNEDNREVEILGLRSMVAKRPVLVLKDIQAFDERKPTLARNIDFLQKWLSLKAASSTKRWKEYMVAEGFEPPQDFLNIEVERFQVLLRPMIRVCHLRGGADRTERAPKRKLFATKENAESSNATARRLPP